MNPLFTIERLILTFAAITALGTFCAWRSSAKTRRPIRIMIAVFRFLALACLAIVAVNPGHWKQESEDKTSEWAIMVDRSLSMATSDVDGKTRWKEACRITARAASFAENSDDVKIFAFSDKLESAPDLTKFEPSGETTDILQAGKSLLGQYQSGGKLLKGIVLLSDGRQIAAVQRDDLAIRARSREAPIFALAIGGDVGRKDLSIVPARRQYVGFKGQKVKINAVVTSEGFTNIRPVVRLLDGNGTMLDEQKIEIGKNKKASASFEVSPGDRGYYQYSFHVLPWPGESTHNNNLTGVGVAVLESKMRIFMAEGTPFWDSKFATQLLRKQPNMEVTSVYRLSGDRFFRVETDAAKVSSSSEAVFPDTAGEMAGYDMVIFGKGVEYFLTPDRIKVLRNFVRNQGGCIIFSRGKPYNGTMTELESIEPVKWGRPLSMSFTVRPTAAGEDCGLFGNVLAGRDDSVWGKLAPLKYAYTCETLKTFAEVLLEGTAESATLTRPIPIIITRRYGKGMVVVVNAEGMWQWDFFPAEGEASSLYKELWTQLVQWSITYSEFLPGQEFSLKLSDSSVLPDVPVRARIGCRESDNSAVKPVLHVVRAGKVLQKLSTSPVTRGENRWETIFSLTEPGTYRIELVDGADGKLLGPCSALHINKPVTEKDNVSANRAFLETLADESGGRVIDETELEKVVASFEPEQQAVDLAKAIWIPAWDKWWLLCFVALFFGLECFLRRRHGLI